MSFIRVYMIAGQSLAGHAPRMSDVLCEVVLGIGALKENAGRRFDGSHDVKG